jgi:ribosomal protein S18 acetylase RimI-like enzyme
MPPLEASQIVGFAEVAIHDDEPHPVRVSRRYGHLQSLVVTERSRRQGAGNRLLAAAEEWARKHGATEMQLDT